MRSVCLAAALCAALACTGATPKGVSPADSIAARDSSLKLGKTKLQAFSAKTGAVIIRGFSHIGEMKGLYGTSLSTEAKEYTDASDGSRANGMSIEVVQAGSLDRKETSYIDYDEIESLLKGLDYIGKVDKSVTRLDEFQADYRTRDELQVSTFSTEGKVMLAVQSGSIGSANALFRLEQASELRTLIERQSRRSSVRDLPRPNRRVGSPVK